MKSIKALREAGFTVVTNLPGAPGTFEVTSPELFYYYNPTITDTVRALLALVPAKWSQGRKAFVLRMTCAIKANRLPLEVVTDAKIRELETVMEALALKRKEYADFEKEIEKKLKKIVAA